MQRQLFCSGQSQRRSRLVALRFSHKWLRITNLMSQHSMQSEPQDSGAPLPDATGPVSDSPERTPSDSPDAGHMVASTPESQKRRHRRRVEDGGTPNPLYELDDAVRDAQDAAQSPRLLHLQLDSLTPDSDGADDAPLDHVSVIICALHACGCIEMRCHLSQHAAANGQCCFKTCSFGGSQCVMPQSDPNCCCNPARDH